LLVEVYTRLRATRPRPRPQRSPRSTRFHSEKLWRGTSASSVPFGSTRRWPRSDVAGDLALLPGVAAEHVPALADVAGQAELEALHALAVARQHDQARGVFRIDHGDVGAVEAVHAPRCGRIGRELHLAPISALSYFPIERGNRAS
jgi:hypothetical protein